MSAFRAEASVFMLCVASLLSTELKCTQGMQVTSTGPQTIRRAAGESATLGCTYVPGPSDTGELDVEWSVVSPDTTQKDQMLMSYTSGTEYFHGNQAKGLSFAARDPTMGDASLSISALAPAHSATYQCKVKKSPGVDMRKVSLVVMVKPSVPKCWVEGGQLVGAAVSLRCQSAEGSTPLRYSWRREGASAIPSAATQDSATGVLKIGNHSQIFAGFYLCEVNNAVGAERCRIALKADKPPNRAGVIAGTIVGSLLLIFILLLFIGLLCWKLRNRHHYEKEFSNDIREDAPPPESRPVSRRTSRSASGLGSQVTSCPVAAADLSSLSDGRTHAPSGSGRGHTAARHAPVRYGGKYGYQV